MTRQSTPHIQEQQHQQLDKHFEICVNSKGELIARSKNLSVQEFMDAINEFKLKGK